jgi:iron(III) transport system permease protein
MIQGQPIVAPPPRERLDLTIVPPRPVARLRTLVGTGWLTGGLALVTTALVAGPIAILLLTAFHPSTALPFDAVPLTLDNLRVVFGESVTYQLLGRTALYACGTVVLGMAIAFAAAWVVERTTLPGRNVIRVLMVLEMGFPGVLIAFAWLLLASPRSGVLNTWLRPLLGISGPVGPLDVYSLEGMIFVTGLLIAPTTFFMLAGFMRRLSSQLEEAGATSGAAPFKVLFKITLPLLSPALLSVLLYQLVVMIQYFEVPLAIGLPGNQIVLSTRIFLLARPNPGLPEYGLAAAFGCLALLLAVALMVGYLRATRNTASYRTVTGKGFAARPGSNGPWAIVALGVVGLHFLLALVLPLAILLWTSLLPAYEPPSLSALPLLGFEAYRAVFRINGISTVLVNTLVVVLVTATSTVAWSTLVALFATRRARGSRLLELVAFLPAALPAVTVALAVMLFAISTPIYGTVWMIVAGQCIVFLAYGSRTMSSALFQLHPELQEAAQISGATWLQTQRRVVWPLLLPTAANTWVWVATHSLRDFTFPVTLASTGNVVLSSLIWQVWSRPDQSTAAAISIMLVVVLTTFVTLGRKSLV